MSPVPVDQIVGGGDGHGFRLTTHMNLLFQLITACHLLQHLFPLRLKKSSSSSSSLSFLSARSSHSTSLLLGICTLGALVAYILEIRPLQGDVHFLTLISRTPHPRAQPPSITEDYYNLHQRLYDLALVCIYASAVIQLSTGKNVITKMDRDNIDTVRNHRHQERYTKAPEWVVVLISLAGAVALAAMSSPLLEAFLGGDFDKERRLSGASTVTAFLLVLWRFVTFLDIFSTTYSLRNQEHKDAVSIHIVLLLHILFLFLNSLTHPSVRPYSHFGNARVSRWLQSSASTSSRSYFTNAQHSDHSRETTTAQWEIAPPSTFSTRHSPLLSPP
jgi:hypothetical protein